MEDLSIENKRQHKIIMVNRKNCSLSGILDVIAFDENEVILETEQGILMLKGQGIHIKRLTLEQGEVELEGKLDSYLYTDQKGLAAKGESLLGRLFK